MLVEHLEVVALDEVFRDRREAQEDEEIVVVLLLLVEEEIDERPQVVERRLVHVGFFVVSSFLAPPLRSALVSAYGLKEDQKEGSNVRRVLFILKSLHTPLSSGLHAKHS